MFLALLDIRNFREISSERLDDYDIALVEGSITRQDEVERLKAIRAQNNRIGSKLRPLMLQPRCVQATSAPHPADQSAAPPDP